jgi:hypothetical protein
VHEVIHFFTHAEKGFIYTSKQMLISPGKLIKDYVAGNRKNYQPPVSYFLVWNAIFLLVVYLVNKLVGENRAVNFGEYFGPAATTRIAISHLNLLLASLMPLQALYVWLIIGYGIYNYWECMVIMLYILGTILLGQALYIIIGLLWYGVSGNTLHIQWSDLFKVFIMSLSIIQLVKLLPVKQKTLRTVVLLVLVLGTFTLWRLFVFPGIANWIF